MIRAICTLEGIAPYGSNKQYDKDEIPAKDKESHHDYEVRTWKNRGHYTEDGHMYIPTMAFKHCLAEAAKFLSEKIPGRRNNTYTKHFEAGLVCEETIVFPETRDTVLGHWQAVPSDGVRGGGKRVNKCFPMVPKWDGDIVITIFDHTITEDAFTHTLTQAGMLIGVGTFRVRNIGEWGRFLVKNVDWQEL